MNPTPLARGSFYLVLAITLSALAVPARAATYSGNGNSGFGGPIGLGSLT